MKCKPYFYPFGMISYERKNRTQVFIRVIVFPFVRGRRKASPRSGRPCTQAPWQTVTAMFAQVAAYFGGGIHA